MSKKKWIKAATAEGKGKLHEHLGVPQDEKIPEAKLDAATHSKNPTIRREANLAKTLKGFHQGKPSAKRMRSAMYGEK